ncbi:MAG: SPFH domain-containing protein [Ancrocorticia sp.]|uniref:SPFH domain-containing protein n=1 Tax=Ancrocorticia sp. TaxID=2593684 RepID=UPI003F8E04CC
MNDQTAADALPETATEPVGHSGVRAAISETPARSGGSPAAFSVALLTLIMFVGGTLLIVFGGIAVDAGENPFRLIVGIVLVLISAVTMTTVIVVSPGMTSVRQFFGRYIGTVRKTGLVLVPPFTNGKKVSVKVHNFETNELKVNDADGNPINISAIVVWQVSDTARAVFSIEDYEEFIKTQAEAALRHVATIHPYDEPSADQTSLRGGTDEVSTELAHEVAERVALAGLEIVEVRISSLAYAPEIAQAMLQRQQAGAIIAAREQIVEGAVSMVEQALGRLEAEEVVILDDERRAQMVSNLLVVLTSDHAATPVINASSLYS